MNSQESPFALRLNSKVVSIKLYRDNQQHQELHQFRQKLQVDRGGPLLYSSSKKKLTLYRLIFAGFAAFFIFLAACLWGHSVPFAITILSVSESILFKNMMGGVAALLGGAALCIGATLRTERDVAARLMRKARRQLSRQYARKKVENFGVASFALKTAYQEALGTIRDHHAELLQLFEHIAHSSGIHAGSREHLFNQALAELNQRLYRVVRDFSHEGPFEQTECPSEPPLQNENGDAPLAQENR